MEAVNRSVMLGPGSFKQLEVSNNHWQAYAPQGANIDDIKKAAFWSLWANKLRPFDRIDVIAEDGSWLAELLCIQCGKNWAQVFVKTVHKLSEPVKAEDHASHRIEYKGPKKKWCIIRKNDSALIKESLDTQIEAATWLKQHEAQVS